MFKEHRKQLIISSIIILLPIAAGLLLWKYLPDTVATHWTFSGEADGWSSKAFAVFLPPVFMLITHWLCILVTFSDPRNKNRNKKIRKLVLWTIPFVSLFSSALLYGIALDTTLNAASITFGMVGIMFLFIGNYLPKTSQNYTIGIKVPWALASEENWNATHRFGGKVYVAGGLTLVLLAFLPTELAIGWMVIILLIMAFIPMIYSWLYFRRQVKSGTADASRPQTREEKQNSVITKSTLVFLTVVFIAVGVFLCSGSIVYTFEEDTLTIDPSYWSADRLDYEDITALELRHENVSGSRIWGLGSFRLLLGHFENEEFGHHIRYTYYDPQACIVVTCGEKVLVLSGKDAAQTEALYAELIARTEG
ncbi:MAG: SdpI family protein [Oscillospiraceae bacterium]|nr:SdpI family protein [Oscillospiraceae bacterium]